jgi:multidrug efflux pump subunit AcrA (membrane-fusion protein)
MNLANLLPVGIASLTALALALPNLKAQSPQTTPQPTLTQQAPFTSPRRLTVKVSVAGPSDLKVKEGDRIKTGQLIAGRSRERTRLNSQKQQLTLSRPNLQSYTPFPPTPPQPVPAVKALPPTSYLEHQAN